MRGQERGTPFAATFAGTVSSIAILSGTTGRVHFVTDISGSTDIDGGKIELRDGTTVLWQDSIPVSGTGNGSYIKNFNVPISGSSGNSISIYVGSATSVSFANIAGYYLP